MTIEAASGERTRWAAIDLPVGTALAVARGDAITRLELFGGDRRALERSAALAHSALEDAAAEPLARLRAQLEQFFARERHEFDLELRPAGTDFQQRVWRALQGVPWGSTVSYEALAKRVGSDGGARTVGQANAQNPICIVIPCHRVIGADGKLTGYAGGLAVKRALLELEGSLPPSLPLDTP
jgi:methylated-DNA-[protein]-cysteine S-methyltransferase